MVTVTPGDSLSPVSGQARSVHPDGSTPAGFPPSVNHPACPAMTSGHDGKLGPGSATVAAVMVTGLGPVLVTFPSIVNGPLRGATYHCPASLPKVLTRTSAHGGIPATGPYSTPSRPSGW